MNHALSVASWTDEQEAAADPPTHDSDETDAPAGRYGPPTSAISDRPKTSVETRRQLEVWG